MRKLGELLSADPATAQIERPGPAARLIERDEPTVLTPPKPKLLVHSNPNQRAVERGYLARELVQCTLPHRDPKTDTYFREDGKFVFMIEAGTNPFTRQKLGLPFGLLPRLLMLFVNTEAVRIQGAEDPFTISFGHSVNEWLRLVGCNPATGGGKRSDAKRLRDQHERLFRSRMSFGAIDGDAIHGADITEPMVLARQIRNFWDFRNPDQGSLWESFVVLDPVFQQALVANPVPYDLDHIRAVKRSLLALDIYCWLIYRLYRANNQGVIVPLSAWKAQFGTGYTRDDNFKAALQEALELVSDVFPAIHYEFTSSGIALDPVSRRDLPVAPEQRLNPADSSGSSRSEQPAKRRIPEKLVLIPSQDMWKAKRAADKRGLDFDEVYQAWTNWVVQEAITVNKPAAHFMQFIKTHDPTRSL
jgi:hypothetical protein